MTNLASKVDLVLGDFVEQSGVDSSKVSIVGVNSDKLLYVKLNSRREIKTLRLVDKQLNLVKGTHRVILHLKVDK